MMCFTSSVAGGEYCSLEEFDAICPDDHVVQMLNASFGRMRIGKCIHKDPGCDVDALPALHRNCSGLRHCKVQVSSIDKQLKNITSRHCSKEHRLHLEAYYRCIPVESEPDQSCQAPEASLIANQLPIRVSKTEGYLASVITKLTYKGSSRCPWRIQGLPGQTIQISLLDSYIEVSPVDGVCQIYAYIRESSLSGSGSKLMDCGYDSLGHVFTSLSESVDVTMIDNEEYRNFVIHFKAVGCPDIQPEGGSEVIRTGNRTRVVCGDSTWTLDCVDNEWLGEMGKCNLQVDSGRASGLFPWPKEWGQVVVGVCIVRRRAGHDFQPVSQNVGEYGVYGLQGPVVPGKYYYPTLPANMADIRCTPNGSNVGHYTNTMQRHQAVPPNGMTPPGGTLPGRTTLFLQQQDVSSCCSCPVHAFAAGYPVGTYHDRVDASGWQTFPIRRPEHIYHSPKLNRKDNKHDPPYYHELDPEEVKKQLMMEEQKTITSSGPPRPPNIPVPPIPQDGEVDSGISGDTLPLPLPSPITPDSESEVEK
ncbi:hypothetical protein LSH36_920g02042 [Paralvinella palmiformis]|uniref:SUEL-type lectin domain-containing protein n=1 Tax=Paralvinella palmiformis TaxID=53620 RepID=A0AAD9MT05_9ANNE|nr:hypothetical protein LSH36_920g02042 [Paralvinella palmiformis]